MIKNEETGVRSSQLAEQEEEDRGPVVTEITECWIGLFKWYLKVCLSGDIFSSSMVLEILKPILCEMQVRHQNDLWLCALWEIRAVRQKLRNVQLSTHEGVCQPVMLWLGRKC